MSLFNPSPLVSLKYRKLTDHANTLAKQLGWDLHTCCDSYKDAFADFSTHTIHIAPIRDEETYAAALHELGHAATTDLSKQDACTGAMLGLLYKMAILTPDDVERVVADEAAAWEWGKTHALLWSDAMQASADEALQTYTDARKRLTKQPIIWSPATLQAMRTDFYQWAHATKPPAIAANKASLMWACRMSAASSMAGIDDEDRPTRRTARKPAPRKPAIKLSERKRKHFHLALIGAAVAAFFGEWHVGCDVLMLSLAVCIEVGL
jgi:hypothetical protein